MCGIIAYVGMTERSNGIDAQAIADARDTMERRGPDAAGLWMSKDGNVVLGHRRLSIIDLSASANQPMLSADGRLSLVFNGEIYNYRELRAELERSGCQFRTQSDTEVILHLYQTRGVECARFLDGMFAFAIWDERDQSIFLARDPLGIKPIYYYDDGEVFVSASQVSAFRKLCPNLTPDPVGHLGFFVNGYVPDPFTMFKEIKAIRAGTWIRRSKAGLQEHRYYSIYEVAAQASQQATCNVGGKERGARIREALSASVGRHLLANVDVGLFLSSGADSTTIGCLAAAQASERLKAITLGARAFEHSRFDEVPLAAVFAKTAGLDHIISYIDKREFSDARDDIIASMDQPSIDGVNTYFISKIAAANGLKVVLSGLGGDELFRGYPSFRDVPRIVDLNRYLGSSKPVGAALRRWTAPLFEAVTSPKYASLVEYGQSFSEAYLLRRALHLPWELAGICDKAILDDAWERLSEELFNDKNLSGVETPAAKVSVLELTHYMRGQLLRDTDWAGMAWSLEIRVPFIDVKLIEDLAPLLFGQEGIAKTDVLGAISHPLHEQITARSKTGFDLPIRDWVFESAGVQERGLRAWSKYLYAEWCRRHQCEPIFASHA